MKALPCHCGNEPQFMPVINKKSDKRNCFWKAQCPTCGKTVEVNLKETLKKEWNKSIKRHNTQEIPKTGYYFIISFRLDPGSPECVNIGIVAFSPKQKFLKVITVNSVKRMRKMFGRTFSEKGYKNYIKDELPTYFYDNKEQFYNLERAKRFLKKEPNSIQFSIVHPCTLKPGPTEAIQELFDRYVKTK